MAAPDEAFFRAIPWCKELLDDTSFTSIPARPRLMKESTEDALIGSTLKTPNTIEAWLTQRKNPSHGKDGKWVDQVRTLLQLQYGINGFANVCHGGIVATIIDESMGMLLMENYSNLGLGGGQDPVTASLKVSFVRPVLTPSVILARSFIKEIKGKKLFVEAEIVDSKGNILARGEALWIKTGFAKERL